MGDRGRAARAHRERKAGEHASVDDLRIERRALKRGLSDAVRGRERAETAFERANVRAERLAGDLVHFERLRDAEAQIGWLLAKNEQLAGEATESRVIEATPG